MFNSNNSHSLQSVRFKVGILIEHYGPFEGILNFEVVVLHKKARKKVRFFSHSHFHYSS